MTGNIEYTAAELNESAKDEIAGKDLLVISSSRDNVVFYVQLLVSFVIWKSQNQNYVQLKQKKCNQIFNNLSETDCDNIIAMRTNEIDCVSTVSLVTISKPSTHH